MNQTSDTGAGSDAVLLAVDLGIRTGLACFRSDGKVDWYRSRNFGSRGRLRKAAASILRDIGPLHLVAIEGGGDIAIPWTSECRRQGVGILQVAAEDWRHDLLLSRDQRTGPDAKKSADILARRIIDWSDAKKPTSLRHDAAEAICLGFWSVLKIGWLDRNPLK